MEQVLSAIENELEKSTGEARRRLFIEYCSKVAEYKEKGELSIGQAAGSIASAISPADVEEWPECISIFDASLSASEPREMSYAPDVPWEQKSADNLKEKQWRALAADIEHAKHLLNSCRSHHDILPHMDNRSAQLTADTVIEYGDGSIVLVKRRNQPFEGKWALPGGKMEKDETIEATAVREAKEETGLDIELGAIVGIYSKPDRDPRGRYVSVVFVAKPVGGQLKASSDAKEIQRTKEFSEIQLAFDHNMILADYLRMRR